MSTIKSFPAYEIVEPSAADCSMGALNIRAGETYAFFRKPGYQGGYALATPGSAASYALKYNDDPIKSYNDCIERGHETHWINLNATSLTAWERERTVHKAVSVGQVVRFEGRLFLVQNAPNGNFKLIER